MTYANHDGPLCAQLGHFVSTITAVYCPHQQAWLAVVTAGDDQDDTALDSRRIDFGPFDGPDDVTRRLTGELTAHIQVRLRQWLASSHARDGAGVQLDEPF